MLNKSVTSFESYPRPSPETQQFTGSLPTIYESYLNRFNAVKYFPLLITPPRYSGVMNLIHRMGGWGGGWECGVQLFLLISSREMF